MKARCGGLRTRARDRYVDGKSLDAPVREQQRKKPRQKIGEAFVRSNMAAAVRDAPLLCLQPNHSVAVAYIMNRHTGGELV